MPYPCVIGLMHGASFKRLTSKYAKDTEMHRIWLTLCFALAWEVHIIKKTKGPIYAVIDESMLYKLTKDWHPILLWKHCDKLTCEKLDIHPKDLNSKYLVATIVILPTEGMGCEGEFTQLTCTLPRSSKDMFDGIQSTCISLCAEKRMWPPRITCDSPFCVNDVDPKGKVHRKGNALYCSQLCGKFEAEGFVAIHEKIKPISQVPLLTTMLKEIQALKKKQKSLNKQIDKYRSKV